VTDKQEPREVFPVVIFRDRPAFGDFRPGATVKKDFRAKVVKADDATPIQSAPEEPAKQDPKAVQSATVSATPSEHGSNATQTILNSGTPQLPIPQLDEGNPASAEKDTPPTPESLTGSGNPAPLVEGTGPEQGPIDPPPTPTSSSLLGDRPPMQQ